VAHRLVDAHNIYRRPLKCAMVFAAWIVIRPWRRCDSTKGRGRMRRRPRDSVMCRQSGDMAFVVHTLMQDPNDIDTICRLTIKQNVRSGRIQAVASAHLVAFPA
jgi:hypothetical protein